MKIFTVYRSGGQYKTEHIHRLARQVREHSGLKLDCLFESEYSHWWSKMDLFRENGPLLYFDLDTTIVDDLSPLIEAAKEPEFISLRDFNYPKRLATGVMGWNGDMRDLHAEFASKPSFYMNEYQSSGDQGFVDEWYVGERTYWQDILPDQIQSYKLHIRRNTIHPDCRVVAFHGKPKPWEIDEITKE